MRSIKEKIYETAGLCVSVISLLPIVVLGFFSRPSMDDYDYSIIPHEALVSGNVWDLICSPFKNLAKFYVSEQGTFTNSFFLAFNPMIYNEKLICIVPLLLMIVNYCAVLIVIGVINRVFIKRGRLFVHSTSAVIMALLYVWIPSVTEGLYWFCGALTYTPWIFGVFVVPAAILDIYFCEDPGKRKRKLILSTILTFIISGACQTVSFEQILILSVVTVYLIVFKKKYYSIINLSAAVAGFLISFLSPGTASRQSAYERAGIIETVIAVIYKVRDDAGNAFSIIWFLSLIAVTPFIVEMIKNGKEHFPKRFPIIQILACLMVICGMWCVPFYPTQTFGAPRLWNAVWITFIVSSWYIYSQILGWLVNTGIIRLYGEKGTEDGSSKAGFDIGRAVYRLIPVICLCALIVCTKDGIESNTFRCIHDIRSGRAAAFAAENDARFKLFNESEDETVYVDPIQTKNTLLYFGDIYIFPDEWPNCSVGAYYGKKVSLTYDPFTDDLE